MSNFRYELVPFELFLTALFGPGMELTLKCTWCKHEHSRTVFTTVQNGLAAPPAAEIEALQALLCFTTGIWGLHDCICYFLPAKHMEVCPKRPKKGFECPVCLRPFTQHVSLLKHKAHSHNIYPEGHAEKFPATKECPRCKKEKKCGFRMSKFNDHVNKCPAGRPTVECETCGNPKVQGLKHKCRIPEVTGLRHKRPLERKFFMVAEYDIYCSLGEEYKLLYLTKVGKQNVDEKLQSAAAITLATLAQGLYFQITLLMVFSLCTGGVESQSRRSHFRVCQEGPRLSFNVRQGMEATLQGFRENRQEGPH